MLPKPRGNSFYKYKGRTKKQELCRAQDPHAEDTRLHKLDFQVLPSNNMVKGHLRTSLYYQIGSRCGQQWR